jgi:predicted transcriptional regulator
MLFDVGVPASTIAKLLGKTERAVHMRVAADREKKAGKKARPTKKKAA